MNSQEQTYHLINQYLNGELTGRALDNFKAKLKDPEFEKEVLLQTQLVSAIEAVRKEELKQHFKDIPKVRYMKNEWGNKWTYASAAIVVLFVSAFFVFKFFAQSQLQHRLCGLLGLGVRVHEVSERVEVPVLDLLEIRVGCLANDVLRLNRLVVGIGRERRVSIRKFLGHTIESIKSVGVLAALGGDADGVDQLTCPGLAIFVVAGTGNQFFDKVRTGGM